MNPILTLIGFIVLFWFAKRTALLKRDDQIGFRPPKKSLWQKIFGKRHHNDDDYHYEHFDDDQDTP